MDSPKKGFERPNHTQTPNIFFDDSLPKIKSFAELKVILAVVRQTFGWHKAEDKLSISQLVKFTGLTRQGVVNGVAKALEDGFLERQPVGQSFFYSLKLVNEVDQLLVNEIDQSQVQTSQRDRLELVNETDQQLVNEVDSQKKGIKEKKERVAHPRDPLLDNPHVVAYRDVCRLTANAEQRKLIAATVTDAVLWNSVLRKFMAEGQKPQHVDWLIERYAKGNGSRSYVDAELVRAVTAERIREMRDGR